jgi:hypothetical protein
MSDDILDKIVQYSKGDFTKENLEEVRGFVYAISHVVNKKIAEFEHDNNISIKLPPLPKKIPTRKNNRTFVSMPVTGVVSYNTGVHGSFSYPTTVNVNPGLAFGSYMLDPFGNSGETIIDRINKIKKYIKIYNQVKKDVVADPRIADDYYVDIPVEWGNKADEILDVYDSDSVSVSVDLPSTEDLINAEKDYKPKPVAKKL